MTGLIIHREYFNFHEDTQVDFYRRSQETIDNVAFPSIGPVFFVWPETKLIFDADTLLSVLPEAIMLYLARFMGKIISAVTTHRSRATLNGQRAG